MLSPPPETFDCHYFNDLYLICLFVSSWWFGPRNDDIDNTYVCLSCFQHCHRLQVIFMCNAKKKKQSKLLRASFEISPIVVSYF